MGSYHGHVRLEFSHIKLLILDECHQAIRDHAYGSIVKQYKAFLERKDTSMQLPRLFAITTALLKTHCTSVQLEERIANLHYFFWYVERDDRVPLIVVISIVPRSSLQRI
jgi:superfamily II DNA or RNA helicase